MKRPHSTRKSPIVIIRKVLSLKIRKSGRMLLRLNGLPGSRERMSRLAMMRRKRKMKPSARVAQAKPAEMNKSESMRTKKMPPSDPPQLAIPVANPRRMLK